MQDERLTSCCNGVHRSGRSACAESAPCQEGDGMNGCSMAGPDGADGVPDASSAELLSALSMEVPDVSSAELLSMSSPAGVEGPGCKTIIIECLLADRLTAKEHQQHVFEINRNSLHAWLSSLGNILSPDAGAAWPVARLLTAAPEADAASAVLADAHQEADTGACGNLPVH